MRFPEDISYGATGGPSFNTEIIRVVSGAEKRNRLWSIPQYRFECAHGVKSQAQLDILLDFFYDVGGKATAFRFKNWAEYVLTKTNSEIQRPVTATLKVFKNYSSYSRRITKIVDGTFKLYADDVLVTTGYTVDIDTGIITLSSPGSYAGGVVFTCEAEYDFWVRFDTDQMLYSIDNINSYSWGQIPLVEVKESI